MTQSKLKQFFSAILRGLAFPAAVLVVHVFTLAVYDIWWPYDIPMHFLGGVSIAVGGAAFLVSYAGRDFLRREPRWFLILFLVGLTMTVGVLWEFMEFGFDLLFHTVNQQGLRDTMGDLAMDLVGGVVGALLGTRRR